MSLSINDSVNSPSYSDPAASSLSTSSLSCGFESGEDCSWVSRAVSGNTDVWKVWRGRTPAVGTGPNSAQQGNCILLLQQNLQSVLSFM